MMYNHCWELLRIYVYDVMGNKVALYVVVLYDVTSYYKLRKGKALRRHGKIAASVLLKLFTSSNE